ncbi:MAG: sensor histidine kinase [Cyanobacteria bacterium J06621_8]
MVNLRSEHPWRLLLYLEWILLGIALFITFGTSVLRPHHRWLFEPMHANLLGITCLGILGVIGLSPPRDSKVMQSVYIIGSWGLSWAIALLVRSGERIFPVLLLIVAIRGCLLFGWGGRIAIAVTAYASFLMVQILSILRISWFGIAWGRPIPRALRRLPPEELRPALFGFALNSTLLYAFVLGFVLLLVSAVIAEHESRTKLVEAHRRLRDYALRIEHQATLQERNRIAREIHDSVGHYLTAQSIQLENTALFFERDSAKAASHLAQARELGKEALKNIRASVAILIKNPLQQRSLKQALEELIVNFQASHDLIFDCQINLPYSISTEIKTSLYRIVQEALTNIAKHSQATKVTLNLEQTKDSISLLLQDNGKGFALAGNTTGFGLQGMRERVAALEGRITIDSAIGKGCSIYVVIPLSFIIKH